MKKSFLFFQAFVFLLGVTFLQDAVGEVTSREIKIRTQQAVRKKQQTLRKRQTPSIKEQFRKKREYPLEYLKKTVKLFSQRKGKNIVEIGSMRNPIPHPIYEIGCRHCLQGHSTIIWAHTLANVYTVDIEPKSTEITKEACKNFNNVHAFTEDGIGFLKKFDQPIDLLFLDAWDVSEDVPDYAEKHLEAYFAAKHRLHPKSLILIDDTDIMNGGKGKLVIPQAIKDGYRIVFSGRQTLLVRK